MYTNETDVTKHLSTANTDISQILKGLCSSKLREIIKQNADVLAVRETKIDASFPSVQFLL